VGGCARARASAAAHVACKSRPPVAANSTPQQLLPKPLYCMVCLQTTCVPHRLFNPGVVCDAVIGASSTSSPYQVAIRCAAWSMLATAADGWLLPSKWPCLLSEYCLFGTRLVVCRGCWCTLLGTQRLACPLRPSAHHVPIVLFALQADQPQQQGDPSRVVLHVRCPAGTYLKLSRTSCRPN